MLHYLRKIKIKFVGDAKYIPNEMPEGKFIPVIGYSTRTVTINKGGEDQSTKDEVLFHCIGVNGKMVRIVEFNCLVMIDEKAELDVMTVATEMCGKLSMAIGNCNSLLKFLSSEVEKRDVKGNGQEEG